MINLYGTADHQKLYFFGLYFGFLYVNPTVCQCSIRAKTILERLDGVKEYINFEIAALFPSPCSRVKKCGNFKTNTLIDSIESFLYYLSSNNLERRDISLLKGCNYFTIQLNFLSIKTFRSISFDCVTLRPKTATGIKVQKNGSLLGQHRPQHWPS